MRDATRVGGIQKMVGSNAASPHPLFDPIWYRFASSAASCEGSTLDHYTTEGWRQLASSHPLFSIGFYFNHRPDVRAAGIDPLEHYITLGWKEGANPHSTFDTNFYVSQVQCLDGKDPLTHFVTVGHRKGLQPIADPRDLVSWLDFDPSCVTPATLEVVLQLQRLFIQTQTPPLELHRVYRDLWNVPDDVAPQTDEILGPDPDVYDESAYLARYPDVRQNVEAGGFASGLEHWLACGFQEELRGLRDGAWRSSLSMSLLKDLIAGVVQLRSTSPAMAETDDLPPTIVAHVKQWRKTAVAIRSLAYQPLISIVVPIYDVDLRWLNFAIESVFWQIYQNWELCLVDDASTDPRIAPLMRFWAGTDPRIKVKFRQSNGHISAASNDALAIATGEYVALLDHDDELTVDALAHVAFSVNKDRELDFLYSDEDKIDTNGNVCGRFFKPAWSPEFLLTCGYTAHLSIYRKAALDAVGGFRSAFDGAQDYDLVLRVTEKSRKIEHIPLSLYHWRMLPTSTATSGEVKSYALPRAKAALEEHMQRIGFPGRADDGAIPGSTHPTFRIKGDPLVSLLIPTANKTALIDGRPVNLLENFVASIVERSTWKNLQIIILENGDLSDKTLDKLDSWNAEFVRYEDKEFNIARKINLGAAHVRDEYMLILNDDMEVVTPDWIEQMLQFQQQEGVGMVGAKLLFGDRSIQHIGVTVVNGDPGHPYYREPEDTVGHGGICAAVHNVTATTGACSMTRKSLFDQVGGYDDSFASNYNDVDFCFKLLAAKQRIIVNPKAVLLHYESLSKKDPGQVVSSELELFHNRWKERYPRELYMRCV